MKHQPIAIALLRRSPRNGLHHDGGTRCLPLPIRWGEGRGEGLRGVVYPAVLAVSLCAISIARAQNPAPALTRLPDVVTEAERYPSGLVVGQTRNVGTGPGGVIYQPGAALRPDLPAAGYWLAAPRDGESPVSVVSFHDTGQKHLDETAEDLNILSYILAQNLERTLVGDSPDYKLGIPMLLKAGGRAVEATYLEGFGALFTLKVRFPLMPPEEGEKGPLTKEDSEWEQARRALAGAPKSGGRLWATTPYEQGEKYDAELVATLKKRLIEALKNASNLRHVQKEEWVVVTLTGTPASSARAHERFAKALPEPDTNNPLQYSETRPFGGAPGPSQENQREQERALGELAPSKMGGFPRSETLSRFGQPPGGRLTIMTLRIRKADAESFAQGRMSEDQFAKTAQVTTYLGPALQGGPPH